MGGGQQLARRFFAQDIALPRAVGDHEGRVGHTSAELAELQRWREAVDMFPHIGVQLRRVEAVGFLNGDRLIGRRDSCDFFHDETNIDLRERIGIGGSRQSCFNSSSAGIWNTSRSNFKRLRANMKRIWRRYTSDKMSASG